LSRPWGKVVLLDWLATSFRLQLFPAPLRSQL